MDWHPKREKRIKRHSLDYRVPRDRQLDSLKFTSDGVILITDTVYVVRCPTCKQEFRNATEWESTRAFSEHRELNHPNSPNQHEIPSWFRSLMTSREADIAKLQYDHENHDY